MLMAPVMTPEPFQIPGEKTAAVGGAALAGAEGVKAGMHPTESAMSARHRVRVGLSRFMGGDSDAGAEGTL
jgi:hypothetical protein